MFENSVKIKLCASMHAHVLFTATCTFFTHELTRQSKKSFLIVFVVIPLRSPLVYVQQVLAF